VTIPHQIVPATWHDLNQLRQIEKECFGPDTWPLWDLIAVLTLPGIVRLKAVVDGRMVGFVAGDPKLSEGVGWITTLGVTAAYRRQGIARALLKSCEEGLSLPVIKLSVRKSNQAAINLYATEGYKQAGVWAKYYTGGEDALVLEKIRQINR
jgi:ribosomal protein S18 acetylase RimI-like enzyme